MSVIGRICCDSNGKLNSQSVILEGSQELFSGQQIKLDLSELRQFALFPGQVVYFNLLENCSSYDTPHRIMVKIIKHFNRLDRNRELVDTGLSLMAGVVSWKTRTEDQGSRKEN